MYLPAHFAEHDPETVHALIRANPLGMLVAQTTNGLDANHLPFEFDPQRGPSGTLIAHVARANPLLVDVPDGAPVLVVFRGPQAYVSPSWYPSKHETHKQVPTWNYEVVHAHGRLRLIDDEKFVRGVVARLTRRHEADEPTPWKMGDAPRDHLDKMLSMIVGIEIGVTRIECKRKLSQNREARDREGVASTLRERGEPALAAAMQGAGAR